MKRLAVLALAASAVACGDATGPAPFTGGVAFGYSGAVSGNFVAGGDHDTTGTKPWAGAWRIEGTPLIVLAAVLPRSETTHDAMAIVIPRVTPGTASIASICPPDGCADVFATFGRQNGGGNDFLQGCHIVSGSVTIATISETRVTGSFTGTGTCFSNTTGESAFEVSNGMFDVPLLPDASAAAQ